eukprot:CAMPEP_0203960024 /NCGR_PEP_ID=MMETSP0359-20131031/90862_1 /ASSEMBLY_ACC=CAM_ASM_000338 /TAXON_ID=268821 /ORGANISM="Scrippsiella Hangoei, Strain SHTV-5" /LENGTH=334 /DNA_ID=CAMNT_0050894229 /DNA_START=30 /DNA_END=1031 /DNA_ORIENTATION=+
MTKMVTAAALSAVPAAAFVPQGSLHARPSELSLHAADLQIGASSVAEASSSQAAVGIFGLTVAGLAASASRASRKQPKVVRRNQFFDNGGITSTGVCAPFPDKFDPLKLSITDAKMERYTAVEIKHGRVAMIATLGYVVPELFHFPGCENFTNGLGALNTMPVEGWVQLVAFIGAHEILVKPRANGMGAYDFGFGSELLEGADDAEIQRRQTSERNNGRLAMMAILGMMWQDGTFGMSPFALMRETGLWGPNIDFIIKDIPACAGGSMCALKPAGTRVARNATALHAEATEEPRMSVALPYLKNPEQLDGWVGGEKGFDPMNITMALPVYWCRE